MYLICHLPGAEVIGPGTAFSQAWQLPCSIGNHACPAMQEASDDDEEEDDDDYASDDSDVPKKRGKSRQSSQRQVRQASPLQALLQASEPMEYGTWLTIVDWMALDVELPGADATAAAVPAVAVPAAGHVRAAARHAIPSAAGPRHGADAAAQLQWCHARQQRPRRV
jgi:hypothetical protein